MISLPMFSPANSFGRASGKARTPRSMICSREINRPSFSQRARSARACAYRSGVVRSEEPGHRSPSDDELHVVGRSTGTLGVVLRDAAAEDHAPPASQLSEHRVEDLPADVVQEDVDPVGRELPQPVADVLLLVVDRPVEAELVDDPAALLRPAAIPITRQPLILAIWPAMLPTPPAAPEMTTVSPALTRPTSSIPK